MPPLAALEYVLPLRWESDEGLDELTAYLRRLSEWVDVTVVDGSPPSRFAQHRRALPFVRHLAPTHPGTNGKARGAMTGIGVSRHDHIVIADDDVRYERAELLRMSDLLQVADFVRPQNVFEPLPWHARWDTGRSLLNRALGGDFSGTVGLRRPALHGRAYDTDVLFENLELERTVQAAGGSVLVARDLCITRLPPSLDRFREQRVRQAYDDFAQPVRLVRELLIAPLLVVALARRRWVALSAAIAGILTLAEVGRRRGGRAAFAPTAALWAPLWVAERAVTVWIAVALRLRGGVRYRDARLARAATPLRRLRRTQPAADPPASSKEEPHVRAA